MDDESDHDVQEDAYYEAGENADGRLQGGEVLDLLEAGIKSVK